MTSVSSRFAKERQCSRSVPSLAVPRRVVSAWTPSIQSLTLATHTAARRYATYIRYIITQLTITTPKPIPAARPIERPDQLTTALSRQAPLPTLTATLNFTVRPSYPFPRLVQPFLLRLTARLHPY
ncbi:hypothetical protein NXS19_011962 [Fusarium pseudograminearum]|nr:hypothetical protein NXS19_011962 [Fusarium pseudograminearum]